MGLELMYIGFKVGLKIAMPVGSMTILCIRRSLTNRLAIGIATGLGIAMADSCYAIVAGIAMSSVANIIDDYRLVFQLLSVIVVTFLGITTLRASTPEKLQREQAYMSVPRTFFGTLLITFASPMTILLFAGLFSRLAAEGYFDSFATIPFISIGVASGAATWFTILSSIVHSIRKRFTADNIAQISLISGIGLLGFAGWQLFQTIAEYLQF